MKKLITIAMVAVMLLVPMMAQALQSLEDTRIARPAPTSEEPSGCPLTASKVMQSIRKTTDGGLAGLKSSIAALKTAIEKKDTEMAKAIERKDTETALEISGLRTDMKDGFSNMSSSINSLDRKLTDKKDGEFSKTNAKIDSIDSAILWMTIAIIAAIAALGLLVFFRTRGTNKLVKGVRDKVDAGFAEMRTDHAKLPKRTAEECNKLKPIVITHTCKTGEEITFTPTIFMDADGIEKYRSAYVPKSVTGKAVPANPADIARVAMTDVVGVRKSSITAIETHFDKLSKAAAFPYPVTDQEKHQAALIAYLVTTPELKAV